MYYYIIRSAGLINIISQKIPSWSTTEKNVLYFHVCFVCVCVYLCCTDSQSPNCTAQFNCLSLTLKIHRSIWLSQSTESGSASRSCSVFGSYLSGEAVQQYRKLRRRVSSYSVIKFNMENFFLLEKECKMFPFTEWASCCSLSKMTVHCSSSSYSAGGRQDGSWNHSLHLSFCRTQLRTSLSHCFSLSFHNSSCWVRNTHTWAREQNWHSSRVLRWAEFRATPWNSKKIKKNKEMKEKISILFYMHGYASHTSGPIHNWTIPPTPFDTLNGNLLIEKYEESCERRNFFGAEIQFVTWLNLGSRKETFVSLSSPFPCLIGSFYLGVVLG